MEDGKVFREKGSSNAVDLLHRCAKDEVGGDFADCFPLTALCPAGCFGWEESCTESVPGANSLAGAELPQWCESSWTDEAYHYVWGLANESCP